MKRRRTSRCAPWFLVLAQALSGAGGLQAANRFFVDNKDLLVQQSGQTITLQCDNDIPIYGVSMALKFETSKINITGLALAGAWSAPAANNDVWSDLKFNNTTGDLIIGVVYDFSPTGDPSKDNVIPIGTAHPVVTLTVNVLASAATTTLIDFRDRPFDPVTKVPEIKNIMTNSSAASVVPTLADQTLAIKSLAPVISSLTGNSGTAGTAFFAVVTNLDLPGLTIGVKVCGKDLTRDAADGFKLLSDKKTLSVVAPTCATVGFAPITVTTDNGSATVQNGFEYLQSFLPVITGITGNTGQAGKVFQVTGTNFGRAGRVVKVCTKTAIAALRGDGITLDVTAPSCGNGWAVLEICTGDGCDSDPNGFDYLAAETNFIRGDSNNDLKVDLGDAITIFNDLFLGTPAPAPCRDALDVDDSGSLDLTDGVSILLFLFQGGGPPKAPFPDPGIDPTNDTLPSC
jgi:hypothetical protein